MSTKLSLQSVAKAFGTNQVLRDVSLDINTGEVVSFIGASGSGKTTFTRLIQGLYPVQEGVIRFDGVDIREIDLAHLRRSIGVVLQDNQLLPFRWWPSHNRFELRTAIMQIRPLG